MLDTVIKIENLSKQYRLGTVSTGTLSHDINRWWHKIRGKEDPYLKIGEINDRTEIGDSDYVWALKDINLEVKHGDRIGIIGKNGAGKSTLLKILSKVTGPTTGEINIKGRIGSLLEVGTGFHPELTGRENIYMNGTILGMHRWEVAKKLDEIVAFAGVAKYLDTPVKRYSSGMMVRLGFAVAAHLEPDILVVDEVLAVGDAEFQKKAIGKMKEVSEGHGRTILFVSHNMTAVKSLCNKGILLINGRKEFENNAYSCVEKYLSAHTENDNLRLRSETVQSNYIDLKEASISVKGRSIDSNIEVKDNVEINVKLRVKNVSHKFSVTLQFMHNGDIIFVTNSAHCLEINQLGDIEITCDIPSNFFNSIEYSVNILVVADSRIPVIEAIDYLIFNVSVSEVEFGKWMGVSKGYLKPQFDWELK